MIHVRAVELERAREAVAQRDAWFPSERALQARPVGVEVADVDDLLLRWPLDESISTRSGRRDQQRPEVAMRDWFEPADIEDLAVARVARARAQEGIGRIVNVHEVAHLRAVAIDLDLAVLEREADEPADEALAIV